MKDKIKDKILLLQYIAFSITILVLIITNINNGSLWVMLLLCVMLIFSFYIRNMFLYFMKYKNMSCSIFILDIVLTFLIIRMDLGASSSVFLFILISDMTLNYGISYGLILALIGYTGYAIHLRLILADALMITFVKEAWNFFVEYTIICSFILILKFIMKQNEIINGTLNKLTAKTLEQDMTYQELMEAYRKLEDITILRERNKLAREIHDVLGHTLTTVLVEMEAGKILLLQNKELGLEKLDLAEEQIRKGMVDLRNSVSLLLKGDELVDIKASLESFIQDTQKHTGVIIQYDINLDTEIDTSLRKTLFRALQEGITNGIKHGNSSVFVFKLNATETDITFLLQDNGRGCSAIVQGFGLKSMQERIKEVNGTVTIESEPEEGFSLSINIPLKQKTFSKEIM